MAEEDALWLEKLCKCYMGQDVGNFNALHKDKINLVTSSAQKAAYLAHHLSKLLTNLNSVKYFFQAGVIRLMSREDAERAVNNAKSSDSAPYVVRASNTNPGQLAITFSPDQGKPDHILLNDSKDDKNNKGQVLAQLEKKEILTRGKDKERWPGDQPYTTKRTYTTYDARTLELEE